MRVLSTVEVEVHCSAIVGNRLQSVDLPYMSFTSIGRPFSFQAPFSGEKS
jgi:hypothetical protein